MTCNKPLTWRIQGQLTTQASTGSSLVSLAVKRALTFYTGGQGVAVSRSLPLPLSISLPLSLPPSLFMTLDPTFLLHPRHLASLPPARLPLITCNIGALAIIIHTVRTLYLHHFLGGI